MLRRSPALLPAEGSLGLFGRDEGGLSGGAAGIRGTTPDAERPSLSPGGSDRGSSLLGAHSASIVELDHLFIDPAMLRQGIGSALFDHALHLTRSRGLQRMTMISDPHAVGFYEAKGAVVMGSHQSECADRSLPILEVEL